AAAAAPATAAPIAVETGCGACDVCLGETLELPADEALLTAQKIISAAWRVDGRFGAGHVIDVLLGRRTDKVERAGHDRLGVYGLLATAGEAALRSWIDQLVVQGYLALREDGMFSFLVHTEAGKALCKGQGTVRLGRDVAPAKGKRGAKAAKGAAAPADVAPADQDLFARLRTLRKLIADHHGVPPYIVFNDVTLRALASQRPTDDRAMLTVKGVGESKLARYGAAFLAVIAGTSPEAAQSAME
ncbi:MAG: HRDC domain-containing protein, partial [Planctomycetes bacterium]|nr:HRDC domain-containing protein [Planctomycetota bacterium]